MRAGDSLPTSVFTKAINELFERSRNGHAAATNLHRFESAGFVETPNGRLANATERLSGLIERDQQWGCHRAPPRGMEPRLL
jgi:hypothetical protein